MKENKVRRLNVVDVYMICLVGLCILSAIENPNKIVAPIFALVYIALIYFKFNNNFVVVQLCTLLLFAVLNSNFYFNVGGSAIYGFYVIVFLYYMYLIFDLLKNKRKSRYVSVLKQFDFWVVALIIVYGVFTIFISNSKSVAISSIKSHIISMSVFIIILIEMRNLENLKEVLSFFRYLLVGILALSFLEILGIRYGMANHFQASNLSEKIYPHIKRVPVSFFFNPNNYCVFLVASMIIVLGFILYENRKIDYLIYLACLITLIFGMSRTAWITLLFSLGFIVIFFVLNKDKINVKKSIIIAITTVIIFQGLSFIPQMQPFYGKMQQLKEMEEMEGELGGIKVGEQGSINIRSTLIVDVTQGVFKEHHLLGFGPGNTSLYIKQLDNTFGIYNLHSLILEILGDYGVLVLGIFIVCYIVKSINLLIIYLKCNKEIKEYVFISGVLMFNLILLSFAPSTVMNFPMFWVFMGIAMGVSSIKKNIIR